MEKIRLTENEKRDILKYIEADKPLPEKYRWLLFEDKKQVELVWSGKTQEITKTVLPFQTIEVVDEPRAEDTSDTESQIPMFGIDGRGRQIAGWTNKLIWGDNKLILSSLKSGPLREEIEKQGGLKLIYIDPPFDVGADFSMKVEIGDDAFTKKPNVLEELAYRDTWGKGADSFIAMIYERLSLMHDLLAEDGSVYVHCDYRASGYLRLVLDEIFGKGNFLNEIIWGYRIQGVGKKFYARKHDTIFYYSKDKKNYAFKATKERVRYEKPFIDTKFDAAQIESLTPKDIGTIDESISERKALPDRLKEKLFNKHYAEVYVRDVWDADDTKPFISGSSEYLGYPTQKPLRLLERIINTSTDKGDLVADFFCGSGTTLAAAEKLGRKWIGSDLGKFSIHTTRKRMIGVQREMKDSGEGFRAFEILNLGKYERQYYTGVNESLREEQKSSQLAQKEAEFVKLIVRAYKAELIKGFKTFVAKKAGRLVAIGPIDLPASRLLAKAVLDECHEKEITKVDLLSFEFEMGLFPKIQEEAKEKGVDLTLKYIPREVFDKTAVEANQIEFHDVSYIEIKPHVKRSSKKSSGNIAVELTDFSVFYNQDIKDNVIESLKKGSDKVLVENGNIIKVSKDKNGIVKREVLTKEWTDWIDYWAVDFDFENKKEIVRVQNSEGEFEEQWTGNYIFENEWQSFRTKNDRSIELKSVAHECKTATRRKIAVKVVDNFGNDTMKVIEVNT